MQPFLSKIPIFIAILAPISAFINNAQTWRTVDMVGSRLQKTTAPSTLKMMAGASSSPSSSSMMPIKKGSQVALITPMLDDGTIDEQSLRNILEWHVESGTDGIVALGTTGEAATMSMEERATVLHITRSVCKGKIPITVGIGTINPVNVKSMAKQAFEYGADAALLVTPYYVKPVPNALVAYFNAIAQYTAETCDNLPIILYNVPGRTGCDMKPETVQRVAEANRNVIGIKEATGDVSRVADLRERCGADFLLFSGDDESSREFTTLGGDGTISVTANILPAEIAKIQALARKGETDEATTLDAPLLPLHQDLFCQSNPVPCKYALHRMGKIAANGVRMPLAPLDREYYGVVENALKKAGVAF